jgi:hypothetical protein
MLSCEGKCFEKEMSIVLKALVVLMDEEGCVYLWFSHSTFEMVIVFFPRFTM